MPEFEESTGFKMKGFSYPGKSPLKQAIGGGAGEAIEHWKKYQANKARDKAIEKLTTDKNISRKAFDTKLAEVTKTVDPHSTRAKDVLKKQVPKQVVKQVAKKSLIKTGAKVASRAVPVIGEALMTYDVLKTGVKRIAKGVKTGVPQTKLKGKNIKDTFKRVKKKKYI